MLSHWQCALIGRRLDAYRQHRTLRGKTRSWEQVGHDLVEFDYTLNPDAPREDNPVALGESLRRFTDPRGRGSIPNDTRMAIVRDFLISEGFLDEAELHEVEADAHLFSRLNETLGLTGNDVLRFADRIGGEFVALFRPRPGLIEHSTLAIQFREGDVAARVVEKTERFQDPRIRRYESWSDREKNAWRLFCKINTGWAIMSPHWGATLLMQESYGRENTRYDVVFANDGVGNQAEPVDLILSAAQTVWETQHELSGEPIEIICRFLIESGGRGGRIFQRVDAPSLSGERSSRSEPVLPVDYSSGMLQTFRGSKTKLRHLLAEAMLAPGVERPDPETFLQTVRQLDIDEVTDQLDLFPDLAAVSEAKTGATALHLAAAFDSRPLVRALLATSLCDLTAEDHQGLTCAAVARRFGSDPVISRLLARKEAQQRRNQLPPES